MTAGADSGSEHELSHGPVFVLHEHLAEVHDHGESSHVEHGFNLLVSGHYRMAHGSELEYGPGCVAIMPAGMLHRAISGHDLEYWLVGFCAGCIGFDESQNLMAVFRRVRAGALPVVVLSEDRRAFVIDCLRALRAECELRRPESREVSVSWLRILLAELVRAMPATAVDGPEGSLVADALAFIQQHCLAAISLRDVAKAVHRSPAHVAETVKNATGHSVGAWITSARMSEARTRLLHTDDAVDEIARHVGWKDVTHFIRQFKKSHDSTPAAWRKLQQSRHAELPR